jgi:hypothetical protein
MSVDLLFEQSYIIQQHAVQGQVPLLLVYLHMVTCMVKCIIAVVLAAGMRS